MPGPVSPFPAMVSEFRVKLLLDPELNHEQAVSHVEYLFLGHVGEGDSLT